MRHHASVILALLVSTRALSAQTLPACAKPSEAYRDSLTRVAARLHPEIADSSRNGFAVVALVFDSDCRLIRHAFGYRRGLGRIDPLLAQLFPPSLARPAYSSVGTALFRQPTNAELRWRPAGDSTAGSGRPLVIWAVLQTD